MLNIKKKIKYLKSRERSTKNPQDINQKKDDNSLLFRKTVIFEGMTDSKITLSRYYHQVPNYNEAKVGLPQID